MLPALMLSLSLIAQQDDPIDYYKGQDYAVGVADWRFMQAQEEFVMSLCYPAPIHEFIPPNILKEFKIISSTNYYKIRNKHIHILRSMGPDIVPWLFWGLKYEKMEGISTRQLWFTCTALLKEYSVCAECGGKGEKEYEDIFYTTRCKRCKGLGNLWSLD